MTIMKRAALTVGLMGLALELAGCGLLHDNSNDYRTAENLPPMQVPAGQEARPLRELYPIPPATAQVTLPEKFEVPKPKPLAKLEQPAAEAPSAEAGESRLTLAQDGNGYPTLNATGGFNQVWDKVGQSLSASAVKVEDRNQSLGLYYLELPNAQGKAEAYQLKITRGQNAYSLSLQKDDDTLAPQVVASSLFAKIQAKWR